jgi:alkylated DNA repair protein (DNA oxidative demethylase)
MKPGLRQRASRPLAARDLFEVLAATPGREVIADGAMILRGFLRDEGEAILRAIDSVAARAPFRRMVTPGGFTMSAAMTNCGRAGWITDRRGYRYTDVDPESGRPWPELPALFVNVARRASAAAGFPGFVPDACLINCYEPGARLSLHQDRNERDFSAPIVSVSLGVHAIFLFGGAERSDRPGRWRLEHGDVVVWGGPARLAFHGVAPLAEGEHPLTGSRRFNLTLRKAL